MRSTRKEPVGAGRPSRPTIRPVLEVLEDRTLLDAASVASLLAQNGASVSSNSYSETDILVQFRSGATPAALPGTALGTATGLVSGLYTVQLGTGVSVAQAVAEYQADANVLSATPDYLLSVAGTSSGLVPNDPNFSQQWDLQNTGQNGGTPGADIQATQAWTVTTGSPNVTVAVMDTGIDYNNPNLYLNVWINQAEVPDSWYTKSSSSSTTYDKLVNRSQIVTATPGIITFRDLNNPVNKGLVWDNNGDGVIDAGDLLRPLSQGGWDSGSTKDGDTAHPDDFFGWNFVANSNNPFDQNGHGTFVSGTIGAVGNDGIGVAGVDWNVQLMPVQFLGSDGTGSISAFIAGLSYSIAHGAQITNNSWSGATNDPNLLAAIQNAQQHGQIFVAAAGNGSSNNDATPQYPASFPVNNVVSVAATDNQNNLANFSAYGATSVALAAPGENILGPTPNNTYSTFSGTSMSAPLVTGVMALVWGEHPSWTYTQVINQVLNTVTKVPSLKGMVSTGGVLNAAAAVGYVAPSQVVIPAVVSAVPSGPTSTSLNQFLVTFNEPISPAHFPTSQAILTGPNGQNIPVTSIQPVTGSQNAQYVLSFATQTQPGVYTLTIGPQVWDYHSQRMTAPYTTTYTLPGTPPPPPATPPTVYSVTTPVPVSSRGTAYSSITVTQSFTIQSVTVLINVSAPIDSNMYIYLQAPDGTQISLSNRRGGSGSNFVNTLFTASATTPISAGTAPFTGSFRPDGSLSTLNGKNAKGTWALYVVNMVTGGVGTLQNWTLTFNSTSTSGAPVSAAGAPVPAAPPSLPPLTLPSLPTGNAALPGVDSVFASSEAMETLQTTYYLTRRCNGASEEDGSTES